MILLIKCVIFRRAGECYVSYYNEYSYCLALRLSGVLTGGEPIACLRPWLSGIFLTQMMSPRCPNHVNGQSMLSFLACLSMRRGITLLPFHLLLYCARHDVRRLEIVAMFKHDIPAKPALKHCVFNTSCPCYCIPRYQEGARSAASLWFEESSF